jgi:LmbE family N-acetylglucosaminyl deacetylase
MSFPGEEPPGLCLERVLVVSPHFDDAVLSCAHVVAAAREAVVVTVFGGRPERYPPVPSAWDERCGFRAGDDVVARRRAENTSALEALAARDESCALVDAQYRDGEWYAIADVVAALQPAFERFGPTTVVLPLGIGHRDHRLACAAALALRRGREELSWAAYAEYPYAWREVDWETKRLARLRRRGYRFTPVLGVPATPEAKAAALSRYESQLVGLELGEQLCRVAAAPEHLWRVSDRPPLPVRAARRAAYELERRRR